MSKFYKPISLVVLMLFCLALVAGCANSVERDGDLNVDNNDMGLVDDPLEDSEEIIYGYITEINMDDRVIFVDAFDLIKDDETDRVSSLNLNADSDFINHYYISNDDTATRMYPIATVGNLVISDFDYYGNANYNRRWHNSEYHPSRITDDVSDDAMDNSLMGMISDIPEFTWTDIYQGDDFEKLKEKLGYYQHIPFKITIINGEATIVEEMDVIYR